MTITNAAVKSTIVGYPVKMALATKGAQNDSVIFATDPGVIILALNVMGNTTAYSANEGWKYAEVLSTGAIADVTTTTVAYDGGTANERLSGGYYVMNGSTFEVMYVKADSGYTTTSGNLTVVRGCLGTTPTAIANNDLLWVMNVIVLTTATTTGKAIVSYLALPDLQKAKVF